MALFVQHLNAPGFNWILSDRRRSVCTFGILIWNNNLEVYVNMDLFLEEVGLK